MMSNIGKYKIAEFSKNCHRSSCIQRGPNPEPDLDEIPQQVVDDIIITDDPSSEGTAAILLPAGDVWNSSRLSRIWSRARGTL